MTRIYLAGPMSGLTDFNYPAFNEAAASLRALGFDVENPAENAAPTCGSWAGYMRLSIVQMLACDCVVFLPGWEDSKGAQIEMSLAKEISMPRYKVGDVIASPVLYKGELPASTVPRELPGHRYAHQEC
jgi:hypothetical protein